MLYHNSDFPDMLRPENIYEKSFWSSAASGVGYLYSRGRQPGTGGVRGGYKRLDNRALAAAHLHWVHRMIKSGRVDTKVCPLKVWSPLTNIVGSAFVTASRADGETYSCWGSWEKEASNTLFQAVQDACGRVLSNSWGKNKPLGTVGLDKAGVKQLEITLIAPKRLWETSENGLCVKPQGCFISDQTGGGATYLPSVWKSISNARSFTEHLKQTAGVGDSAIVQTDTSITWKVVL